MRLCLPLLATAFLLVSCDQKDAAPQPKAPATALKPVVKSKVVPAVAEVPVVEPVVTPVEPLTPSATRRKNLAAALAEKDAEERVAALEAVVWEAIDADPEVFREAMKNIPLETSSGQQILAHLAMKIAAQDPEGAMTLALSLAEPADRSRIAGDVALSISETAPARAAAMVDKHFPKGPQQEKLAFEVLSRWTGEDPTGAAVWVSGFPKGPGRSNGIRCLMENWINSDAESLSLWLESKEGKAMGPEALTALAEISSKQPEAQREQIQAIISGSLVAPATPAAPMVAGKAAPSVKEPTAPPENLLPLDPKPEPTPDPDPAPEPDMTDP